MFYVLRLVNHVTSLHQQRSQNHFVNHFVWRTIFSNQVVYLRREEEEKNMAAPVGLVDT